MEPEHVEHRVPVEVATVFRDRLGVDVADVPVRAGRAVARQAAGIGARAFARGGKVFMPSATASGGDRAATALLAHELTHVVQQQALGQDMPAEDSAAGRGLEEAARSVERWFLGEAGQPELVHRTPRAGLPADTLQRAATDQPLLSWTPETGMREGPSSTSSWVSSTADPAPSAGPDSTVYGQAPAQSAPSSAPSPLVDSPSAEYPGFHTLGGPEGGGLAEAFNQIAALRSSVAELHAAGAGHQPEAEEALRAVQDLEGLAGSLYPHIRGRLRAEQLVDRERAGLLADLGGWR